jgi:phage-related protein
MATFELDINADASQAIGELEKLKKRGVEMAETVSERWLEIGAAGVGLGLAIEGFARSQQDANIQTKQLAESLDMSEGEVRKLATSMSDATFPLEDVLDLMELGRQQGLDSAEALEEYATFWDMVGDATGSSGPILADAGTALRQMGIAAGEEGEALAAFGFITEETTQDVDEFLKFIGVMGPDLQDLGLDIDDTAAILGAMERELGLTGKTARQEFRAAIQEADGDLNTALDTLGLSEQQFHAYRDAVEDSSHVIERNAGIVGDAVTPMQQLESWTGDLAYRFGGVASQAANMAPLLMGLGPAIKGVTLAKQLWAGAQRALNLALIANPIGLVVTAIAALAAGAVIAYRRSETFRNIVDAAFSHVRDVALTMWSFIDSYVLPIFRDHLPRAAAIVRDRVGGRIQEMFDTALRIFTWFRDRPLALAGEMRDGVSTRVSQLRDWVTTRVQSLRDNTIGRITSMKNDSLDRVRELRDDAVNFFRQLRDRAEDRVTELLTRIRGKASDIKDAVLSPFRDARDSVAAIVRSMGNNVIDPLNNVLNRIEDFVNTFGSAINWVANQLGMNDLVGAFSIGRIPRLHSGTKNWSGGPAILHNEEMAVLPPGSRVFNAAETKSIVHGIDGPGFDQSMNALAIGGLRGAWDSATDALSGAWDSVTDFGRDLISRGASWALGQVMDRFDLSLSLGGVLGAVADELVSVMRTGLENLIDRLIGLVEDEGPSMEGWVRPASGVLTQRFGNTPFSHNYASGLHSGIDIGNARGTPVLAANAGTVAAMQMGFAPNTGSGYGNWLRIDHGGAIASLYAHLLDAAVKVGQMVEAGQRIARMDNTGFSTGDHLHFEIIQDGQYVDPANFIPLAQGAVFDRPTLGLFQMAEAGQTEIVAPEQKLREIVRDELNRQTQAVNTSFQIMMDGEAITEVVERRMFSGQRMNVSVVTP